MLLRFSPLLVLVLTTGMESYVSLFQVPYYLAELTEKNAEDDRVEVLKASQAKLKVKTITGLSYVIDCSLRVMNKTYCLLISSYFYWSTFLGIHFVL